MRVSEGWTTAALGDVGSWGSGGTPLRSRPEYFDGGSIPWLKIGDLGDGPVNKAEECITDAGFANSATKLLDPGHILVAMYGSIGKLGWNLIPCTTNQAIAHCDPFIDRDYLFWLLRFWRERLQDLGKGGTQANISQTVLKAVRVPIAPLAEQRRIVAKLDAILTKVRAARDRFARVRRVLESFRRSVLAAACDGRLTKEWRTNRGVLGDPDSGWPGGWTICSLESLASKAPRSIQSGPFGSNLLHSEFQSVGGLVIGIDNVGDGVFLPGRQHRISPRKFDQLSKYSARPNDVLVTVMATVGRVCVVPENIEPAIMTKHVYRITPDLSAISPHYLACALRGSVFVREQISDQVRGQTRPGINGEILKCLAIPVPPLPEQAEIVQHVHGLMDSAAAIALRLDHALVRADELQQAILAQALSGQLLPTEAELARAEGRSYETAEELLARVRREREDAGALPRRRRPRARRASSQPGRG